MHRVFHFAIVPIFYKKILKIKEKIGFEPMTTWLTAKHSAY